MTALSKNVVAHGGSVSTSKYVAATNGDTAPVGSGVFLHVKNGSGAGITATVTTPGTEDGRLAIADDTTPSIPAGEAALIPLLDLYADPNTGRATINYSATASVTVAVWSVP